MEMIYTLVPAMILLALVSVAIFFWAARSGQYDDMEGPAHRILTDDDDPLLPEGHRRELDEDQEGRQTESVEDK
jgi:cbb3-type cytochrome oxidase maturation protein